MTLTSKHVEDHKNTVPLLENSKCGIVITTRGGGKTSQPSDVENQPEREEKATEDGHSLGVKHPTTYWESLFHLIKGNTGSGMFAMGDAFKHGGLLLSPVLTLFLGVVCIYGNHVLLNCSMELRRRKKIAYCPTFPDTMEWAFHDGPKRFQQWAPTIRFLVNMFNIIAQLGFCSVYFIFISSTLRTILIKYGYEFDVHVLMAVILVPILLTTMVRSLKYLVPFSVLANIMNMLAVALTLYISMQNLPPISSRAAVADLTSLPLFFGTIIYCFEGIGLVLPLQSEMKRPELFGSPFGVLNVGMTIIACILVSMGFVGYLKYGEDVLGSLTLNLPPNTLISEIVQVTISIGLLFSYALQFHIAVTFVWPDFSKKYGPFNNPRLAETGIRIGLVLITFTAAEVVPQLGLFISLMGSVSSTALALLFPPLCDLALHWGHHPGPNYFFDSVSILLAVVGFSTGSYYSLRDIIRAFFYSPT